VCIKVGWNLILLVLSGKVGSNFVGETEWCKTITASEFSLAPKVW